MPHRALSTFPLAAPEETINPTVPRYTACPLVSENVLVTFNPTETMRTAFVPTVLIIGDGLNNPEFTLK